MREDFAQQLVQSRIAWQSWRTRFWKERRLSIGVQVTRVILVSTVSKTTVAFSKHVQEAVLGRLVLENWRDEGDKDGLPGGEI